MVIHMKAEILAALRETDGYVSGQELCERFGVSRTAVWKAINQLKKDGYEIEAVNNRGYHIVSSPNVLSANEITSLRKTKWVGSQVYYYDVIDSTNTQANHLAEEGAVHGALVVADRQEAGKGRRGRAWESPANTGIFMTLLLKPEIEIANASMLTLVAALAVTKGIERLTGEKPAIKWPNDIVLNGKKICGILTELSMQIDYINHIIIGIGINVHNKNFPDEIAAMASSILLETGKKIKRAELIEAIWEEFETYYDLFIQTQDLSLLSEEYNRYLANKDKPVRVLDPKQPFEGTARGITDRGELLVETEHGVEKVSSGEVSVRGIYGYV